MPIVSTHSYLMVCARVVKIRDTPISEEQSVPVEVGEPSV